MFTLWGITGGVNIRRRMTGWLSAFDKYSGVMYAFFWVILRRLNFICRRFGTLCSIFVGK